jgi:hypothetical protein
MNATTLEIHIDAPNEEFIANFNYLLQNGFKIEAVIGCTIYAFLNEQCHLPPEYIQSRISTVFLDGNPVDDMKKAIIEQDSTLSLSGAMPGLVGAVMRTGSFYASFRDSITYKKTSAASGKGTGFFKLKLFNILMQEIGPFFFEQGIQLSASDFLYFLSKQPSDLMQKCKRIVVNGKSETSGFFNGKNAICKFDNIFLRITLKQV